MASWDRKSHRTMPSTQVPPAVAMSSAVVSHRSTSTSIAVVYRNYIASLCAGRMSAPIPPDDPVSGARFPFPSKNRLLQPTSALNTWIRRRRLEQECTFGLTRMPHPRHPPCVAMLVSSRDRDHVCTSLIPTSILIDD